MASEDAWVSFNKGSLLGGPDMRLLLSNMGLRNRFANLKRGHSDIGRFQFAQKHDVRSIAGPHAGLDCIRLLRSHDHTVCRSNVSIWPSRRPGAFA